MKKKTMCHNVWPGNETDDLAILNALVRDGWNIKLIDLASDPIDRDVDPVGFVLEKRV